MELLNELVPLVKEGLYVTIICMFVFYFVPIQKIKKQWLMEVAMRVVIIGIAAATSWLSYETPIWQWNKAIIKAALITLAFSSLFYEMAGKFIVRKWFKSYKISK